MLGTFFLALAGLDAGSAFGGMGSSREVAVAALAEPTVIIAVFALALRAGTIDLGRIVERFGGEPWLAANPAHLLAFAAFFIVMLAETGRLPVDNPATHLELTMIHEAMVLEYSGRYLALVEWASAMKLFVFMTLLANLFVPWGLTEPTGLVPVLLGVMALAAKLAVLMAAVALLETAVAKLRLFRVPELLADRSRSPFSRSWRSSSFDDDGVEPPGVPGARGHAADRVAAELAGAAPALRRPIAPAGSPGEHRRCAGAAPRSPAGGGRRRHRQGAGIPRVLGRIGSGLPCARSRPAGPPESRSWSRAASSSPPTSSCCRSPRPWSCRPRGPFPWPSRWR
jgi:hypothetical protein